LFFIPQHGLRILGMFKLRQISNLSHIINPVTQRRTTDIRPYAATVSLFLAVLLINLTAGHPVMADSVNPPAQPVRLIFVHHSTGQNWLADGNGGLGLALRDNNYFVSDTNYGWGPDSIGDTTDIGNWYSWFRGSNSATYLTSLYAENDQHASYQRLSTSPGGENEIIMFKSCFPNSALQGSPGDPVPAIGSNPLKGQSAGSPYHTVANAKGIYIDLLQYFTGRQDKLFIVITAPPLTDTAYADNARAFNNWLVNDWLSGYPYRNVFVFDFYNVLTTNGGTALVNDLNSATGNHHRWWNNAVQYKIDGDDDVSPNVLEYPTGDDHPSTAGNLKATAEFVQLLNLTYNRWKDNGTTTTTAGTLTSTTTTQPAAIDGTTTTTTVHRNPCPITRMLGDRDATVRRLRDLRDSRLAQSAIGRKVIQIYYNNADSINSAFERSPALRAAARSVLESAAPLVEKKEE
jgi:hypothetical protein